MTELCSRSLPAREGVWRSTYQLPPHHSGVPAGVDGPQEAQQQGVAHPLGPVVAAVALPATAGEKQTQRSQQWGFIPPPTLIGWILSAR